MDRRIILLIMFCLFFSYITQAVEFTEGDDYLAIEGSLTKTQEVTEFFSFYCPACFKQEAFMNELKASLPANAVFKKHHVEGMPGRDIKMEHALSKALLTAEILHVDEKIIPAIFNYIHLNKARFNQEVDIKNLFLTEGIEGDKFDKVFTSFSVNTQAKKMQSKTKALRKQGFTGVPTLIVNGKYKPLTHKITTMDEYKKLVLYLLNKTN